MKFTRLHLLAYGQFTNYNLTFGDTAGFHVIYGPNEAGKSTTLHALTSVLYGYSSDFQDDFLHRPADVAVAIELLNEDGKKLSFTRKRRGRNALVSDTGTPLNDDAILSFLGGVSRTSFTQVFALDHQRLRQYAHDLLEEGGDLGLSLAAAGAGIAHLNGILEKLGAAREDIFGLRASKRKLNALIKELTGLKQLRRERVVSPKRFKEFQQKIDELAAELEETRNRQKNTDAEIRRLERIQRNLPLRTKYATYEQDLKALKDIPILPSEAKEIRIRAQTECRRAEETLRSINQDIASLKQQISEITVDERLLAARARIEKLAKWRPVIEKQQDDLPRREAQYNEHLKEARNLLKRAELPGEPENLPNILISDVKRKELHRLIQEGRSLGVKLESATQQVREAEDSLKRAKTRLAEVPELQDTSALAQVLEDVNRLGDIEKDIATKENTYIRESNALRQTIIGLGIPSGEIERLRTLPVPPTETIEQFADELKDIDAKSRTVSETISRIREEIRKTDAEIARIKIAGAIPSEEDLRKARENRDTAWGLVRRVYVERQTGLDEAIKAIAPDGRLLESYEKLVAQADQIADTIRRHVKEVTQMSLLEQEKAQRTQELQEALQQEKDLAQKKSDLLEKWKALWPDDMTVHSPAGMREWLERRSQALTEAGELEALHDELNVLRTGESNAVEVLTATLQAFGEQPEGDSLEGLRMQARRVLQRTTEIKEARTQLMAEIRQQSTNKTKAEGLVKQLEAQKGDWMGKWQAALTAAKLQPDLSIEAVEVILEIMSKLDLKANDIASVKQRIDAMEKDWNDFRDEVAKLADLAPDVSMENPIAACREIERRLEQAKAADTQRTQLSERLETQEKAKQEEEDKVRKNKAILDTLCEQAGCKDPDKLAEIEAKSEKKRTAEQQCEEMKARMLEGGDGLDLAALFDECDTANAAEISDKIQELKAESENLTRKSNDLSRQLGALESNLKTLLGENQAAESLQDAKNIEAQIVELVEEYVDLTFEEIVLRQAIELFRQRNQDPILALAGTLFSELTNGVYTGLQADLDDNHKPILLAQHRDRGSLGVKALSDGTVDPLYLALRLAAIEVYNSKHEPMPFIADDLLLTFDDDRARATLKILSRIAEKGQVLFFTHHTHMVDLAKTSVPTELLKVHILAAPNVAAAAE